MIDYVKILVNAGRGGDGAISFQTLRNKPYGPPAGGDGGDGGNVYLRVSKDLTTLVPYRYKKNFQAENGLRGGKNHKKGKSGEDLFLPVPAGTKVMGSDEKPFADLTKQNEKVMVVAGGKGGRGNMHIKRSDFRKKTTGHLDTKEAWSWFEPGEESQQVELILELKLLADVGFIGLPNAGKSTLLSKLTSAHPQIAAYPFTTLEPNLGVMKHKGKEVVIADIPGLIEGASKGKGLGDLFLRHVERTKILVHLLSCESGDPIEDLQTVNKELKEYSKDLADKSQIYLLTKIDIVDLEGFKNKVRQFKKKRIKVLPISSFSGDGLEELKDEIISKNFG